MGNCCTSLKARKYVIVDRLLPRFDETKNVNEFVRKARSLQKEYKINEKTMKTGVILKLDNKAQDWYKNHSRRGHLTLGKLLEELVKVFGVYEKLEWRPDQSFIDYHQTKLLLGLQLDLSNRQILESTINGMDTRAPALACVARDYQLENTTELLKFVLDRPFLVPPNPTEAEKVDELPIAVKKTKLAPVHEEDECEVLLDQLNGLTGDIFSSDASGSSTGTMITVSEKEVESSSGFSEVPGNGVDQPELAIILEPKLKQNKVKLRELFINYCK